MTTKHRSIKTHNRDLSNDDLRQVSAGGPGRDDYGDWLGARFLPRLPIRVARFFRAG